MTATNSTPEVVQQRGAKIQRDPVNFLDQPLERGNALRQLPRGRAGAKGFLHGLQRDLGRGP